MKGRGRRGEGIGEVGEVGGEGKKLQNAVSVSLISSGEEGG